MKRSRLLRKLVTLMITLCALSACKEPESHPDETTLARNQSSAPKSMVEPKLKDECLGIPTLANPTWDATDIQERIWEAEESGHQNEANELLTQLKQILCSEEFEVLGNQSLLGGVHEKKFLQFDHHIKAIAKSENKDRRAERAAYQVDRLLKLNVVPFTIHRKIEGEIHSVQIFIEQTRKTHQTLSFNVEGSNEIQETLHFLENSHYKKLSDLTALDLITGNTDRSKDNWLLKGRRAIAIDNGDSFLLPTRQYYIQHNPSEHFGPIIQKDSALTHRVLAFDSQRFLSLQSTLSEFQVHDLLKRFHQVVEAIQHH